MFIRSAFVAALLFALPCRGETTFGHAALASQARNFPQAALSQWDEAAPAIYHATLWGTFGADRAYIKSILRGDKPATLNVYVSNEVCRVKGNCARYELMPELSTAQLRHALERGDDYVIRQFSQKFRDIRNFCEVNRNEHTRCLLTLGLESIDSRRSLRVKVKAAIRAGWSLKQLVFNPKSTSPFRDVGSAWFLELHGGGLYSFRTSPGRSIISLDGTDPRFCNGGRPGIPNQISESQLRRWSDYYRNRTRYAGYWCSVWQGIGGGDSANSLEPRLRTPRVDGSDISRLLEIAGYSRDNTGGSL
jgi:hypothetical protein